MKRLARSRLFGLAWAAGVLLTQPAGRLFAAEGKGMRVELDVYSGRPNPSWTLTEKEGAEFLKRLQALPKADSGSVRDGLGYRGLIVTGPDKPVAGCKSVTISGGVILGRITGRDKLFKDKDRAFEQWLFATGKGRIDDPLYEEVKKDLKLPE